MWNLESLTSIRGHINLFLMTNDMPQSLRKQPITLLEILIVMAILALVSGVVAVSINRVLTAQRFQNEVSMIVDELNLAQNIMTIMNTDVRVMFKESPGNKGIEYWLEMDTLLSGHVQKEINRRKGVLKTIRGVFFQDELISEISEGKLDVKFLSSGAVMSRGIMRLATTDNENPPAGTLQTYICLVGYPHPIVSVETKEEADKICADRDVDFDTKLTQDTVLKIPEQVKKIEPQSSDDEPKNEDVPKKGASPGRGKK